MQLDRTAGHIFRQLLYRMFSKKFCRKYRYLPFCNRNISCQNVLKYFSLADCNTKVSPDLFKITAWQNVYYFLSHEQK
jgi:hypothetical protein